MNKPRLASIIGTRPQIIKHSILSKALIPFFEVSTIYTGQHWDPALFQSIFSDLQMSLPDITLNIPLAIDDHQKRLSFLINNLKISISNLRPELVLVFGDTDSTLAAAEAASESGIPLVHIEAGERSFNPEMREEYNRTITDELAEALFCVSKESVRNLEREGLVKNVFLTGDVMKDLLLSRSPAINKSPYPYKYYYASLHRNYTQADKWKLVSLIEGINHLDLRVIFSLHPSTKKWMDKWGIQPGAFTNIDFIEPVNYTKSLQLQKFSEAVLTDSGGMQKEAYWLKKPCITLRKETEWTATLKEGWNKLCYDGGALIEILRQPTGFHDANLYGDGHSSELICKILRDEL